MREWRSADIFTEERKKSCMSGIWLLYEHFVQNVLIYGYLIVMALNGKISASQFLLYFGVARGISTWIDGILTQFNEFINKMAS